MDIVINFLEYGVRGIWNFLWFITFLILAFACLGVVGNKKAMKKQAEMLEKRKKLAEEEAAKAKAQMEKNAQFGGIDTTLDPTLQKKEEEKPAAPEPVNNAAPVVEEVKPAEQPKEEVPAVLELDAVSTEEVKAPVDNTTPIVEEAKPEEQPKEEVPAILVINEDGTSG